MTAVTDPKQDLVARRVQAASPIDFHRHTMSASRLLRYLQIKVHHLIVTREWRRILVVGRYDRGCVISATEKNDKLFNWQRPTARVHGAELVIACFPGHDYVHHYALIIATYLAMVGRYHGQVDYELPAQALCTAAADRLEVDLCADDLVVVGWGVGHFGESTSWTHRQGYAWQRAEFEGRRVVYLGCKHSIWGDVAGRVVARLAELGARRVLYVGKVGSLDPSIAPNTCLATGTTSLLAEGPITWPDALGDLATSQPDVRCGVHVTSPSILLEDQNWLAAQHGTPCGPRFVDPEIGPMGSAARAAGIDFGYLHVISNNLARSYPADLSNERAGEVIARRAALLDRIHAIIGLRLATLH